MTMQNGQGSVRSSVNNRYVGQAAGSNQASPASASGTCPKRAHENGTSRGEILSVHEAGADGEDRGAGAIRDFELSEDGGDMGLDGLLADEEALRNLPVRLSGGEQPQHLLFAR
jgi:hypothetical protein